MDGHDGTETVQVVERGVEPAERFERDVRIADENGYEVAHRLFLVVLVFRRRLEDFKIEGSDHAAGADAPLLEVGEFKRLDAWEKKDEERDRCGRDEPSGPGFLGLVGSQREIAGFVPPLKTGPDRLQDVDDHAAVSPS